jgi:hypothetical protein
MKKKSTKNKFSRSHSKTYFLLIFILLVIFSVGDHTKKNSTKNKFSRSLENLFFVELFFLGCFLGRTTG